MEHQTEQRSLSGLTKLCKHCGTEIPFAAKKCPHCRSDLRSWVNRHPIWTGFFALLAFGFILSAIGNSNPSNQTTNTPTAVIQTVQPSTVPVADVTPKKRVVTQTDETNNQPAAAASPVAAAPAPAASWHTVATFSGTGQTNTNTFTIQGSKWQIDWTITPTSSSASYCEQYGDCDVNFGIYQDDGSYVDDILASGNGGETTSGTSYEYAETGNFYFAVDGGSDSWTATVEDYY